MLVVHLVNDFGPQGLIHAQAVVLDLSHHLLNLVGSFHGILLLDKGCKKLYDSLADMNLHVPEFLVDEVLEDLSKQAYLVINSGVLLNSRDDSTGPLND